MSSFEDFVKKTSRTVGPKSGSTKEILRVTPTAAARLDTMHKVTRISKRALASYAMWLLDCEFKKWTEGKENNFGFNSENNEYESR